MDPARIAVAGQSDGAEAALAVGYLPGDRDRRVHAAVILSGADFGAGRSTFPAGTPPLLAAQGTADTINAPSATANYFRLARSPKYLLWLLGAEHLPPYTGQPPWFAVVTRVTTAFLDRYLKGSASAGSELPRLGRVSGVASLTSLP